MAELKVFKFRFPGDHFYNTSWANLITYNVQQNLCGQKSNKISCATKIFLAEHGIRARSNHQQTQELYVLSKLGY